MTKLQRVEMWAKTFNPKAQVERADARYGRKYAVVTKDEDGKPTTWTDYLSLDTLCEVVRMLMNYNSFIKIKEA